MFAIVKKNPLCLQYKNNNDNIYTNHNRTAKNCVVMLKLQNNNSLSNIQFSFQKMDIIRY